MVAAPVDRAARPLGVPPARAGRPGPPLVQVAEIDRPRRHREHERARASFSAGRPGSRPGRRALGDRHVAGRLHEGGERGVGDLAAVDRERARPGTGGPAPPPGSACRSPSGTPRPRQARAPGAHPRVHSVAEHGRPVALHADDGPAEPCCGLEDRLRLRDRSRSGSRRRTRAPRRRGRPRSPARAGARWSRTRASRGHLPSSLPRRSAGAEVLLDRERLGHALVGRAEQARQPDELDAPLTSLERQLDCGADDVLGCDAVELLRHRPARTRRPRPSTTNTLNSLRRSSSITSSIGRYVNAVYGTPKRGCRARRARALRPRRTRRSSGPHGSGAGCRRARPALRPPPVRGHRRAAPRRPGSSATSGSAAACSFSRSRMKNAWT